MKKTLIETIEAPFTNGIFANIATIAGSNLPWSTPAGNLDADYLFNHSGNKLISPLVREFLKDNTNGKLTAAELASLASIIWGRYGAQWIKLYAVFSLTYDPIENYSMTESETESGTNTGTVGESGTDSATIARATHSETESTAEGSIYGYDSATASPSDKQETDTETNGTENGTESHSHSNTRTDNLAHSITRSHTRAGNIGVTTAQQMIESEIKLWQYDFFKIVFDNIDTILTIPIY